MSRLVDAVRSAARSIGQWPVLRMLRVRPSADGVSTGLSLLCGVVLVLWLILRAASELGGDVTLWWHARVAQDLVAVNARVTGHSVREERGDGSWAHKSTPTASRRSWYYAYPVIALEYSAINSSEAASGHVSPSGSFDSRAKAMAWMAANFPVGSTITVLQWPGREGNFLLSPDQAPTAWGLLGQLVVALLMFVFIHLPLALIAAMLVPAALVWLVRWPFVRKRP